MTPVDLESLDRLREAATQGEWAIGADGHHIYAFRTSARPLPYPTARISPDICESADTALIVALVNAWPAVSAELRAARRALKAIDNMESAGFFDDGSAAFYRQVEDAEDELEQAMKAWRALRAEKGETE